jgi:creatinine amidohydrolase
MKSIEDILWSARTRAEMPAWANKGTVVIVPFASTEQHGEHLPLDTDQRELYYVATEAARRLDDVPVLVTPMIAYGISPHHMVHAGTITLSVETALRVLREVCESIAAHGFERIIILGGHGGNSGTISASVLELRHTMKLQISGLNWWDLCPAEIDAATEGPCHTIGHAGEGETSCILKVAPQLVRQDKLHLVENISDDPSIATAEKGERILEAGVAAVMGYIQRVAQLPGRQVAGIERARG